MFGFGSLRDVLDVVMVPTALALLAIWIPHKWQNRQRDSEIKTDLVAEISELVMRTVAARYNPYDIRPTKDDHSREDELNRIYEKWSVDTCVTHSKLHAYFPHSKKGDESIHERWKHFSQDLSLYYQDSRDTNKVSADQWEHLLTEKARIIEDILASQLTGF